jgi:hypothetical protein
MATDTPVLNLMFPGRFVPTGRGVFCAMWPARGET